MFCCISIVHSAAKSKFKKLLQKTSYSVDFQNAAIGLPPHLINGRLHPGLQVGMQKPIRMTNKQSRGNYSLLIGYFAQQALQRALYLKPGVGYRIRLSRNLMIRPMMNLACMGVQQINNEFRLIRPGVYTKQSAFRFQLLASAGLEAGVWVATTKHLNVEATLAYEFGMQFPFSEIASTLPINQLHVGVVFHHKNRDKK